VTCRDLTPYRLGTSTASLAHGGGCDWFAVPACGGRPVSLHYGEPQVAIGVVFAVLAVLLGAAFVVIGLQAGSEVGFQRVHDVGYWLRKRWLALLAAIGVVVVGISLFDLPYASGGSGGRTVVKVTAGQFFWSLQPERVPVGTRVRFDVTSVDVNHGFGLHDPHGHLIGSVQAMPGYHNTLDLTLNDPGVYQIRCLELCGLNHATMNGSFSVVPR
jgi:cytochrome c oxidase subunit II